MASDNMLYAKLFESCPRDWSIVPFDTAIDFQEGPGILAVDFHESGVPLIRLSGVQSNMVSLKGCNFLSQDKVSKKWSHFRLIRGDLLISTSATIGMVSEVGPEAEGAIAYTGLIRLRPRDKSVHSDFIKHFAKSDLFIKQAEGMAAGSVMRHFGPSHLRQMSFVIPPLSEQKRIASILDALDDKIEMNRKMNETLEQMARALFKSWFVDFDPVHAKAAGRQPAGMDKATADLFPDSFVDSELGKIPKGWMVKKVGEFIERLSVGQKYDQKTVLRAGNIPVFDQGKSGGIGFHNNEPGVIASAVKPVVVFANHTCYMRIIAHPFSVIQNVLPFVGYGVDTFWTYYATVGRLSFSEYKGHWPDFIIQESVVPPYEITEAFGRYAKSLVAKIWANEEEEKKLTHIRENLLPKLMKGGLTHAQNAIED